MNSPSQLVRLSIPGSLYLLFSLGSYAGLRLAWSDGLDDLEVFNETTAAIAVIAASVPIGFVVYQLYYWAYGPTIVGSLVNRDLGRDALTALPEPIVQQLRTLCNTRIDLRRHHQPVWKRVRILRLDHDALESHYKARPPQVGLDAPPWEFEEDERSVKRIYKANWYENWDTFRAVLDLVSYKGMPEPKHDFRLLYDIYHALGATRVALVLGTISGLIYGWGAHRGRFEGHLAASAIAVGLLIATTFGLLYVLHRARRSTWKSAIKKVGLDLRWAFAQPSLQDCLPKANGFTPRRDLRREPEKRLEPMEGWQGPGRRRARTLFGRRRRPG